MGGEPFALKPLVVVEGPIPNTTRGVSKNVDIRGGLNLGKRGKEKADPVPMVKEDLPHLDIFPEFGVE